MHNTDVGISRCNISRIEPAVALQRGFFSVMNFCLTPAIMHKLPEVAQSTDSITNTAPSGVLFIVAAHSMQFTS